MDIEGWLALIGLAVAVIAAAIGWFAYKTTQRNEEARQRFEAGVADPSVGKNSVLNKLPDLTADVIISGTAALNPYIGIVAAAAKPVLTEGVKSIIAIANGRRIAGGEAVLNGALNANGEAIDISVVVEKLEASEKLTQLTIRAVEAGQAAYTESHIHALSKALRAAILTDDDAKIDHELLIVHALGVMESVHVKALYKLAYFDQGEWEGFINRRKVRSKWERRSKISVSDATGLLKSTCGTAAVPVLGVLLNVGALFGETETSGGNFSFNPASPGLQRASSHEALLITSFAFELLDYLEQQAPI